MQTSLPQGMSGRDRRLRHGQGLVEYALILVLVAVVVIVILALLGGGIAGVYCRIATTLDSSNTSSFTQTAPFALQLELEAGQWAVVTVRASGEYNVDTTATYSGNYVAGGEDIQYNGWADVFFQAGEAGDYDIFINSTSEASPSGDPTEVEVTSGTC